MTEVVAALLLFLSMSVFLAHAFEAYLDAFSHNTAASQARVAVVVHCARIFSMTPARRAASGLTLATIVARTCSGRCSSARPA
jgi:hypothetical protein